MLVSRTTYDFLKAERIDEFSQKKSVGLNSLKEGQKVEMTT
jgi:hypothetical protein